MNVTIGFPQISSRFVDKEGRIDQAWLQLLITLWNRTGEQTGGDVTDQQYADSAQDGLIAQLAQDILARPLEAPAAGLHADLQQRLEQLESRPPTPQGLLAERGAWTPVLTFATPGDLAVTYAANGQAGRYTKIGDLVLAFGRIVTSAFTWTTAAGDLQITGLPFQALDLATFNYPGKLAWGGITKAGYTEVAAFVDTAAQIVVARASGSGVAVANVVAADVPTAGAVQLEFSIAYKVLQP